MSTQSSFHKIVSQLAPLAAIGSLIACTNSTAPTPKFTVTSTTFADTATVPQSMVFNGLGCTGGDQSPQLSWANPPKGTKAFALTMFDSIASFTHWAMYNIPATTLSLPTNAGVAGSMYGTQVINDFFVAAEYDGPCPPAGLMHYYGITIYALDAPLTLPNPPGFPAYAETLWVGLQGHVLGTATITGLYSIH